VVTGSRSNAIASARGLNGTLIASALIQLVAVFAALACFMLAMSITANEVLLALVAETGDGCAVTI